MSDYSKSTDFAAKDDLPSGNANKVVSGTEINTEFSNIETAVNTKANIASPTFTGTVTIPTIACSAGAINNTTIGASTASTGAFTTLTASGGYAGAVDGIVGGNTPAAGTFTTLTADLAGSPSGKFSGDGGAGEFAIEVGQIGTNGSAGLNSTGTNAAMKFQLEGADVGRWAVGGHHVVGGTTAGAASAVTAYADGKLKVSTGSSGASVNAAADELIVEGSSTTGLSTATPDASFGFHAFASPSNDLGAYTSWKYSDAEMRVATNEVGATLSLRADAVVPFATGSGASGSELLTAAGSVSVTDFLTLSYKGELTISSGVVTATGSYHLVDTESDAASDDLVTINGAATGKILILRGVSSSRDVTLKDGTGNIYLEGDFTLSSSLDQIALFGSGSTWIELARSNNG